MGETELKYRFVPARLVIPSPESKDQRFYIRYQAFSVPDNKVRPFKVYLINDYRKHPQFDDIAYALCIEINDKLAKGCIFNPGRLEVQKITKPEVAKKREKSEPTLLSALDLAVTNKSIYKENTYLTYKKAMRQIEMYLEVQDRVEILVKDFTEDDARRYGLYLITIKGVSNRTHNNNINALKTLWNDLIEMGIVKTNVFAKVKKPSNGRGRNVAFIPEQQKELLNFMNANCPDVAFLCRFMYYTGCRSNELAHLKIKDIYLMGNDKIHIDRKWAKSSNMRQVIVHPALAREIEAKKLKDLPAEWYIFGTNLKPRATCRDGRYLADIFRKKALTPLKYNNDYTLYSWRHTFAVMGHINGMTIAEIGMQLGHQDPQSTNTYLKSLGCFDNKAVKDKLPEL
jgi:integrase